MGCGQNGVSGLNVNHLPLEKSHAETEREPEGKYGSVLVQNTRENSVMEKLLNMAAAMTLMAVKVSAKKNHCCLQNGLLSST